MRSLFLAAALLLAPPAPAIARTEAAPASAILAEAGPGTRWGVVVADDAGREVLAIDPDGRYVPASNTKIVTTAAALWAQATGRFADTASGASVALAPAPRGASDVILRGHGDARLSAAPGCQTDCLATLADAVAARTRRVRDVVGDDTAFPDQRWSPGMSWNNIPTRSGTGISALTVDDNEIPATATPGPIGRPPMVAVSPYFTVENHALTVPGADAALGYDRMPGSRVLIVTGTIGVMAQPQVWQLGVDDPADHAGWVFANMLRDRGVNVSGATRALHRPLLPQDDPANRTAPVVRAPSLPPLASLTPGPLADDIATINTQSQNLHAELLLRRMGAANGNGSIADGQAMVAAMLAEAGIAPDTVSLSDGSGMSSYNRVTPRAMARLLGWIARQPWGAAWAASLPVGGQTGTLRRRFADTPLAGKVTAKTGSLNATNALAGYLIAASGRRLTFAIYANDVPDSVRATAIMDRALLAIAAAN